MMALSSYQKRKGDIKYLSQCINELETICSNLVKNNELKGFLDLGIANDDFITPYNSGDFLSDLKEAQQGN